MFQKLYQHYFERKQIWKYNIPVSLLIIETDVRKVLS